MAWLFDVLRAPGEDLLRVIAPPPVPRFGMLFGTVVVLCSGVLATACGVFLGPLFSSIFLTGDAAARDAAALIKSLSRIDIEDHSANPALQELQRTEEDYVEDLRALANAKAGLVSGGLLSEAKAELLFSNAPVLLTLNEEFLSKLNSSDSSPLLTGEQLGVDTSALGPPTRTRRTLHTHVKPWVQASNHRSRWSPRPSPRSARTSACTPSTAKTTSARYRRCRRSELEIRASAAAGRGRCKTK